MLYANPTPRYLGLELWGDADTLEHLYQALVKISQCPCVSGNPADDFILELQYEVRKSFQGNRLRRRIKDRIGGDSLVYGTRLMWPTALLSVYAYQKMLALTEPGKQQIALTYLLVAAVEQCLANAFSDAQAIIHYSAGCYVPDDLEQKQALAAKLNSRNYYFYGLAKPQRKKQLGFLMLSLHPDFMLNLFQKELRAEFEALDRFNDVTWAVDFDDCRW